MLKPPPPPPKPAINPTPWLQKQMNSYLMPMASEYVPAWVDVLTKAKWPTEVVVVDFETYFSSDYSLNNLSTPEYINHDQWEVLGLAYLPMSAEYPFADYQAKASFKVGETQAENYLRYLQKTYGERLEGITCVVQNASFDCSVLAWRYGIFPKHVVDTASLARAYNARGEHGLKVLCKEWGLPDKGETKDFLGASFKTRWKRPGIKRHRLQIPERIPPMSDEQATALAAYACNDAMREWELFTILLPALSNPEIELTITQHTLEMFTRPVLKLDYAEADRLVLGMEQEIENVIRPTGLPREDISGDKSFEWHLSENLRRVGENPQAYMKVGKKQMLLAIAKDDPERKLLEVHQDEAIRNLIAARSALDSWPLHIKRVRRMKSMAQACDGNFPIPLTYWGAHTGRDAGGQKVNVQNLPRQGHPLLVAMRGLLLAPEGHKLVIVDLAAIEARVNAWVSGQDDLIAGFAQGLDVYCQFGTAFYGVPVRKPLKTDPEAIAKKMTARRQFSKVCILGMGYGMGADRFSEFAQVDRPTAQKAVDFYRAKYPKITGFWRAIERAFLYTAKYKRPCALDHGIKLHSTDKIDVVMTLPNGRELHYHKTRTHPGEYGSDVVSVYNETLRTWEHTWGGLLTENLVQAMSRDVLFEAAIRLENYGHHVVHRVHDELILTVPTERSDEVLALAIKEMSRTPSWAPGLPLAAEGVIRERYGLH